MRGKIAFYDPQVPLHFCLKRQVLCLSHSKLRPMRIFWPLLEDFVGLTLFSRQKYPEKEEVDKKYGWVKGRQPLPPVCEN